jgi:radical SAM protein
MAPESAQGHPHRSHPGPRPGRNGYEDAPLVVTWEVTQACELACRHCRADACPGRHPGELDTSEGRALLDQVAGFGDPGPVVVFTGGDPLMRPDLLELARYGTDRGLRMAVTPASTSLLTRDVLERFRDAGIRRVALSLDGATAASHDGFRGEAGSFRIIREAARHAAELDLPIQINTTVCRDTAGELPAIADLVEEMGAVMWEVFFLVPVGRGSMLDALTPWRHEWLLEWLYRRQKAAPFRVITVEAPFYRRVGRQMEAKDKARRRARGETLDGKGRSAPSGSTGDGNGFVFVSHLGEVFPSGFLPVSAGNVREDHLVELYRRSDLFRWLRDKDRLLGKCGACEFKQVCGGSRARAYAVHGDWLREDPFCPYIPDAYDPEEAQRARRDPGERPGTPVTGTGAPIAGSGDAPEGAGTLPVTS